LKKDTILGTKELPINLNGFAVFVKNIFWLLDPKSKGVEAIFVAGNVSSLTGKFRELEKTVLAIVGVDILIRGMFGFCFLNTPL